MGEFIWVASHSFQRCGEFRKLRPRQRRQPTNPASSESISEYRVTRDAYLKQHLLKDRNACLFSACPTWYVSIDEHQPSSLTISASTDVTWTRLNFAVVNPPTVVVLFSKFTNGRAPCYRPRHCYVLYSKSKALPWSAIGHRPPGQRRQSTCTAHFRQENPRADAVMLSLRSRSPSYDFPIRAVVFNCRDKDTHTTGSPLAAGAVPCDVTEMTPKCEELPTWQGNDRGGG
jgi:hypothetical protein